MLRASHSRSISHSEARKTCFQGPFRAHPVSQPRQHRWRAAAGDDGGIDQFDDNTSSPVGGAEPLAAAQTQLQPADYKSFVQLFRQASPYIEGHRGKTFVVILPGSVSRRELHA
jgi:hypothetical protein